MKILITNPPNLEKILSAGLSPDLRKTVFTFGDTIYNPGGNLISQALLKHEETHSKQQGDDPNGWWDKYLKDTHFRLNQEIEAYQIQYKELKKLVKDKNKLFTLLRLLAKDLSGEMYKNLLSLEEAQDKIKNENSTIKQ